MSDNLWEEFKEWHDRLTDLDAKPDEYGTAFSVDGTADGSLICNTATNGMWLAWKASRAALRVELPMEYKDQFNEPSYSAPAVRNAIANSGVRYK